MINIKNLARVWHRKLVSKLTVYSLYKNGGICLKKVIVIMANKH